jgi:HK97 family phage portal protein
MLADRVARRGEVVRADPVTMEEFGYLLGAANGNGVRTKAGAMVGPRRVLGLSAWYSGVRYLAETVASLPVHMYRDAAGVRDRRADPLWMVRPDVELPWFQLVELMMMGLLHKGNAYAFKLRNMADQVVGLREIHPDRVTTGVAPDGTKRFMIDHDERVWSTRDILHIPGLAYDGRVGLNPIQSLADSLGTVAASDDYTGRYFGSGTHLGGVITVGTALTKEQRDATRDEWEAFHQGLVNAHKTGVLSNGSSYTRLALNAADAQLIEARQFGISEIARILRIPPHKLYDLTRATFSNIEHQSIEAVVDSIRPWVERIEAHVNFDRDIVPEGTFIEFQLEGLLRGDAAARASFYTQGITAGWLSPKRAAELENQPAPDELGYYLRPLNMAVIRPGVTDEDSDKAVEMKARFEAYVSARDIGLLTTDEMRAMEGLAPLSDGDRKTQRTWQEVGLPALVDDGVMTVNEARAQLGLGPVAGGDKPRDPLTAPSFGGSASGNP